jgi:hypothetical protein
MAGVGHGLLGVADAGAFLARLIRLDPAAVVRLRPASGPAGAGGHTALWAHLPWQVLVTRTVHGPGPDEATVGAADLLKVLADGGTALPPRRDADWRWPLPAHAGQVVETVTAAEMARVAHAAAGTLRTAAAERRVGERAVRDALLDHVPIVVTRVGAAPVDVPQRLVQAVVRMGFLGASPSSQMEPVQVRLAGIWTGLAAPYGIAWLRTVNEFTIRPQSIHTNG